MDYVKVRDLGQLIREARERQGLSQAGLAAKLQRGRDGGKRAGKKATAASQSWISRLENGHDFGRLSDCRVQLLIEALAPHLDRSVIEAAIKAARSAGYAPSARGSMLGSLEHHPDVTRMLRDLHAAKLAAAAASAGSSGRQAPPNSWIGPVVSMPPTAPPDSTFIPSSAGALAFAPLANLLVARLEEASGAPVELEPADALVLAAIAWCQPLPLARIDAAVGFSAGPSVGRLLSIGLITIAGRASSPGGSSSYATSRRFLAAVGWRDLQDLPSAEELARIGLIPDVHALPAGRPSDAGQAVRAGPDEPAPETTSLPAADPAR